MLVVAPKHPRAILDPDNLSGMIMATNMVCVFILECEECTSVAAGSGSHEQTNRRPRMLHATSGPDRATERATADRRAIDRIASSFTRRDVTSQAVGANMKRCFGLVSM
jgi:hypothetical protein